MKPDELHPTEWTLKGALDAENISRRQTMLSTLFETAKTKGAEIAQLRQTNLNYALLIFAALFTFSFQFAKGWYSVASSLALCFIMCVFCGLDRRYHKFIHGWRATEKHFIDKMATLLSNPEADVVFRRYIQEAEKTAECWGWQPVITYLLVAASAIHSGYSFYLALRS